MYIAHNTFHFFFSRFVHSFRKIQKQRRISLNAKLQQNILTLTGYNTHRPQQQHHHKHTTHSNVNATTRDGMMEKRNGAKRERMRRKRHKDIECSEYEEKKKRVRARHLPKNTVNDIQMMRNLSGINF